MHLKVDSEGFLRDLADWNETTAVALAAKEALPLSSEHWEVIRLVRAYYQRYQIAPATRVLVKIIGQELGTTKGKSIYLMQLFRGRPAALVAKIAGLPKPTNCD